MLHQEPKTKQDWTSCETFDIMVRSSVAYLHLRGLQHGLVALRATRVLCKEILCASLAEGSDPFFLFLTPLFLSFVKRRTGSCSF